MDQLKIVNAQLQKAIPSLLFIHNAKNEIVWKVDSSGFGKLTMNKNFNMSLNFQTLDGVREEYIKKFFEQRLRNLKGTSIYTTNNNQIDVYARILDLDSLSDLEIAIHRAENFIAFNDAMSDFLKFSNQ